MRVLRAFFYVVAILIFGAVLTPGAGASPQQATAPPTTPKSAAPPSPESGKSGWDPDWGPRKARPQQAPPVFTGPYAPGEVFVSDATGLVDVFKPDGTLLGALNTTQTLSTGMAFDQTGNLFVTTFSGLEDTPPVGVVEFDINGNFIGPFGNFPTSADGVAFPESILFNHAGNAFVGAATDEYGCPSGSVTAYEFDPTGSFLNMFTVTGQCRGTDWVELLPDQQTLLYTSEGTSVLSFNIVTNTQNADLADGLPGVTAYAFRVLPNGNLLVADSTVVVELNASGAQIMSYTPNPVAGTLFALNLDPNGTSFWTADGATGTVYSFDIASGTQMTSFTTPSGGALGLAVFGEKLVGTNNLMVTDMGSGTGTVTSTPSGISCPSSCLASFSDNSNVTLTATAAAGSTFAGFSANCVPANPQTNPPTCVVPIGTADVTVTATFNTGSSETLTVTEAGTGTGTVTSSPAGIVCPPAATCSASFASGTAVILTAMAGDGSTGTFSGSTPTACVVGGGGTTCSFNMPAAPETVTVTFTSGNGPSPALAITKSHTGNFTQGQHSAQYTVTVSNAANAAASSGTVIVTDTTLTAVAQDIATSFSGTSNPNGVWSYGQYIESPPAFSLLTGQDAAFPTCGLPYWSDTGYPDVIANNTGLTVSCGTVTVPTDMLWTHPTDTGGTDADVRWTAPASGTYEITGSYSALDSTSTTDSILVNGTSVFSTFICNPGNNKTCNTVNTLTPFSVVETLTAGSTVDFTVNCCTLPGQTFLFDSTGLTGAIDSNLSGLSLVSMFGQGWTCGPPNNAANICTRSDALAPGSNYPPITVLVNVGVNTPSPATNTVTLSGGGSAPSSASDSAVINPIGHPLLAIAKSHTGNFTQGQQGATYTVTVSNGANAGPTSGTVTVTDTVPAGLTLVSMAGTGWTCVAASCTRSDALAAGASYPGITVTVNVASNASSPQVNMAGVSGGGSVAPPPASDSTVITSTNVLLTIIPGGNGTGTVRSTPAGINCGATCSVNFASGTTVVLTATPSDGSTFTGWGAGPCEGTGTCTITLTSPPTTVSVVANFAQSTNNFTLAVNEVGTGTGTVTSIPAGIVCPPAATCSASFASGQVVTLTATAANGSTFAGWSGAGCTGTGGCSVTMSAAQTVTATFNSGNSPVTIGIAPGSPSTVNTTPGSSAVFGLTLTALPGTTGTVTLGCTSASLNITCNIVPSSITLTGKAINVAIVVNTFCKGFVPNFEPTLPGGIGGGMALLLASMSLCGAMWMFKRRPRWALSFAVLMIIVLGNSACSNLPKSPGGTATKPGLYPLVVTATAPNGAVSSVNLMLNVLP